MSSRSSFGALIAWGHCKLKLTINANQVKCWFLRRGENRSTREENFPVQSGEPTNSTRINLCTSAFSPGKNWGESAFVMTST